MAPKWNWKRFSLTLAMLAYVHVAAPEATAAEPQPWEVGAGVGWLFPANRRNLDDGAAALITFGHRFSNAWGAEIFGIWGNTEVQAGGDMTLLGLRGLYHFYDRSRAWTPYLSFGAAYTDIKSGSDETSAVVGAGLKRALNDNFSLRGELNAQYGFDSKATDVSMFLGVAYQWGKAPARAAPAPVAVAAAAPPPPADTDGDGVPDNRDKCPGTPRGVTVDANGCPLDQDGDGVPDYRDQCPNTPRGTKVDATGCPIKLTEKVSITLKVNFDTAMADIKPEFSPEIKRVADFMRKYTGTRVVIEGYTDNVGSPVANQKLSERRAQAVAQSLVRDHGIASDRVQSVGYGESRAIADNKTPDGRAANRRVTAQIEETVTRNQ